MFNRTIGTVVAVALAAGVASLGVSKAQAQCGGGGYYQPAPQYYSPPSYYAPPTYYAPQTYYAPPPVVYYDTPRVYRSYSVGVNIGDRHHYDRPRYYTNVRRSYGHGDGRHHRSRDRDH